MAGPRQKRKVKRVMHEFKHGELKSGGRRKVKNRRQAIAIAMSESGQSRNRRGRKTSASRRKSAASSARKSGARRAATTRSSAQRRTSRGRKKRSR